MIEARILKVNRVTIVHHPYIGDYDRLVTPCEIPAHNVLYYSEHVLNEIKLYRDAASDPVLKQPEHRGSALTLTTGEVMVVMEPIEHFREIYLGRR